MKLRYTVPVLLALAAPAVAEQVIYVPVAPPAARVEVVPAPRTGYVWVPGYWHYADNADYSWVNGRWVETRPGYVWVPERWVADSRGWYLVPGYWEQVTTKRIVKERKDYPGFAGWNDRRHRY